MNWLETFVFRTILQDLELSEEDAAETGFPLVVCIHDMRLEEFAVSAVLRLCPCDAKTSQVFDRS